jgi:hypothetical protein
MQTDVSEVRTASIIRAMNKPCTKDRWNLVRPMGKNSDDEARKTKN